MSIFSYKLWYNYLRYRINVAFGFTPTGALAAIAKKDEVVIRRIRVSRASSGNGFLWN